MVQPVLLQPHHRTITPNSEAAVYQGLGLNMCLPQGAFLREGGSQRQELTFLRSHCELLQSLPGLLTPCPVLWPASASAALAISWVAEASLCPSPSASSLVILCLPPCLTEDWGCAQLRAAGARRAGHLSRLAGLRLPGPAGRGAVVPLASAHSG